MTRDKLDQERLNKLINCNMEEFFDFVDELTTYNLEIEKNLILFKIAQFLEKIAYKK